ncbi:MAG: hypothetical protein ACLP4V_06020 [Methylocella sp.]
MGPKWFTHPAGIPLTRPTQPHGAQPDRHHIAIEDRRKTILGKQRDLFGLPSAFIEDLDRLAPCHSLAVVDLSKIQYGRPVRAVDPNLLAPQLVVVAQASNFFRLLFQSAA